MHWTLPELYALPYSVYLELVAWINRTDAIDGLPDIPDGDEE